MNRFPLYGFVCFTTVPFAIVSRVTTNLVSQKRRLTMCCDVIKVVTDVMQESELKGFF